MKNINLHLSSSAWKKEPPVTFHLFTEKKMSGVIMAFVQKINQKRKIIVGDIETL